MEMIESFGFLIDQRTYDQVAKTKAAPEVYFVPALSGLGCPHWNPNARGMITGLHRGTSQAQIIRAGLEGVVLQVDDVLQALATETKVRVISLKADGGMSQNQDLIKFQADLSGVHVHCQQNPNSTALGASFFAALGKGLYTSIEDLSQIELEQKSFHPTKGQEDMVQKIKQDGEMVHMSENHLDENLHLDHQYQHQQPSPFLSRP